MKLQTAIYVGRKKPISELTPDQQREIRKAYRDTGWASDFSEEGICICIGEGAEERARKMCTNKRGWFFKPLPVNQCLLEVTADFEGTTFVESDQPALLLNARIVNLNDPVQATAVALEATQRATEELRLENRTLNNFINDDQAFANKNKFAGSLVS